MPIVTMLPMYHYPAFKDKHVAIRILNVLREYEKILVAEFEKTTEYWDNKQRFYVDKRYNNYAPRIEIENFDPRWTWLNQGTTERWAVMPDPFYAKTKPRWIGSSPLGGKPVLRGKKAMTERGIPARRGIRARHWVWTIRQKHEENFKKAVRKAVLEGLEAATLPRGR